MTAKLILASAASILLISMNDKEEKKAFTLNFDEAPGKAEWNSVDDGVMGGLSKGGADIKDGKLHFTGTLSLENNGGFSSIRHPMDSADLSSAKGITLRVLGDGRTYQLRLATDAKFRGSRISYSADFGTEDGEWKEVRVSFSEMTPGWRGRTLDGPPLDLANIQEFGLLIGDKTAGEFKLEVDWIKTYAGD